MGLANRVVPENCVLHHVPSAFMGCTGAESACDVCICAASMAFTFPRRRTCRSSSVKRARRKASKYFLGQLDPDDPRAHAEHVHVVVHDSLVGGVGVVTHAGAHAPDFAGGDAGADAAAAHEQATVGFARGNRVGDGLRVVGVVVVGLERVGAHVQDIVSPAFQDVDDQELQVKAGVVGSDHDSHNALPCMPLELIRYTARYGRLCVPAVPRLAESPQWGQGTGLRWRADNLA